MLIDEMNAMVDLLGDTETIVKSMKLMKSTLNAMKNSGIYDLPLELQMSVIATLMDTIGAHNGVPGYKLFDDMRDVMVDVHEELGPMVV